ncbi:MAG: zinc ABC transporter substrate-binding protein, partial [bacterium]|nr:zinc ABC transporter substrate-binding protein [bacterium]
MKKLLALSVILLVFAGCADVEQEATGLAPNIDVVKPLVYTTNYPLTYFVERIGTGAVDVTLLVPTDLDPAKWKPEPENVLAMQKADLIVLNGASYEGWLKNVSLPPSRLVDTTEALSERLISLEQATTHSHGLEGEHEHSTKAFTTWLDPTQAAGQAIAVKDALSSRWPEHSEQFEAQLAMLLEELAALDTEAQEIIAGDPDAGVLFSHPVYQYFARRYHLHAHSVHWEPDQMPGEAEWQKLDAMKEHAPASWMIWEGTPLPQVIERLESVGIRSVVFDPCANTPESGDYLSVMNKNLEALRR